MSSMDPSSCPLFHTIVLLYIEVLSTCLLPHGCRWLLQLQMSCPQLSVPNMKEERDGWKVGIPLSGRESLL